MASRKVLGNDPFKRGAAPRAPVAAAPPPPRPPAKSRQRRPAPRPPTPELQTTAPLPPAPLPPAPAATPGGLPGVPASPPAGAPAGPATPPSAGPAGPVAHPQAPSATPLTSQRGQPAQPHAHPNSPRLPFEPVLHAAAPRAQALEQEPVAHPNSPGEVRPPPEPTPPSQVPALASQAPGTTLPEAARSLLAAAGAVLGLGPREQDDWGKDAALSRSLRPLADVLFDRYWRVQTTGAELLPAGPCVLVANHAGALPLDGPVLHLALRRSRPELPDARWLLEDQLFFAPLLGGFANRLGAVRATPENAHRLLEEGRPLIVFPEGLPGLSRPFSERHRLTRFGRGGYLKVALRAGVPVLPVALVGGDEASPLLAKVPARLFGLEYLPLTPPPLPARWYVRIGPPVALEGAPAEPDTAPGWVEAKNLEVRDTLQALIDQLVAERPGVF